MYLACIHTEQTAAKGTVSVCSTFTCKLNVWANERCVMEHLVLTREAIAEAIEDVSKQMCPNESLCACRSLCVCVCVCVCVRACVRACVCLTGCLCIHVCLYEHVSVCLAGWLAGWLAVSICLCVSLSLFTCVYGLCAGLQDAYASLYMNFNQLHRCCHTYFILQLLTKL